MTCIAAVVHEGRVIMGGDTAATSADGGSFTVTAPKVFHNGPFMVGYAGNFRTGQLLAHAWEPPARPKKLKGWAFDGWLVTDVMASMRDALKKHGHLGTDEDGDRAYPFLLACAGRLFYVVSDFAPLEATRGYSAVGSGEDAALGALYATEGADPRSRVLLALDAAADINATVRGPFHVSEN